MGYALFLAVNATGVWGGVFPFLPDSLQTFDILFWFYLALALALLAVFLFAARMPYRLTLVRPFTQTVGAAAVYFCGWACLIAAMYVKSFTFGFSVAAGI